MSLKSIVIIILLVASQVGFGQTTSFSTTDTLGCAPYSVSFQSNVPTGSSVLWDFGNGQQSSIPNPTIAFLNPGQYTIKLTILGTSGATDSLVKVAYIEVLPNPSADFVIDQTGQCLNDNLVQFNNTSQNASNFFWDLGDGNSNTNHSPTHSYSAPGNPVITLFASNNIGCTSAKSITIPQEIKSVPDLNFSVSNTQMCDTGEIVQVNYPLPFDSISWSFGDGTISANTAHDYTSYGDFYIGFEMIDTNACYHKSDSVLVTVNKMILSQELPDTSICENNSLHLNVPNGQGFALEWYFNSNLISASNTCVISSPNQGSYPLELIGSKNGCTDTLSTSTIQVGSAQYLNVTYTSDSVCRGEVLSFSCDSALNGIAWYQNGIPVSGNHQISLEFNDYGQSQIYLEALTSNGCFFDTTIYVEVLGAPSVVTFDNSNGCAPLSVGLIADNVNGGTFSWEYNGNWLMGDSINYVFQNPGFHDINLITTDSYGCIDTLKFDNAVYVYASQIAHNPIVIEKCAPYELNMTYSISSNNVWTWDAGDGSPTSTGASISKVYSTGGTYLVSLTTINGAGCSIGVDSFALVHIKEPVDFQPFYTVDCQNNEIILSDSTGMASINWSIPSISASGSGPYISLPDSANYSIMMSLTDTNGCELVDYFTGGTAACDSSIYGGAAAGTPSENVPGVPTGFQASHPVDTVYNCLGSTYFFEYTANPMYSFYSWNMGDGTMYYSSSVMHEYQSPGVYMIELQYDSSGVIKSLFYNKLIAIVDYDPLVNYTLSPSCDGILAEYNAQNSDSTIWSWAGQQVSGSQVFRPLFQSNTVYYTQAEMLSEWSCYADQEIIHVVNNISPKFIYPDSVCLGDTLFLKSTLHSPVNVVWHIGSDTVSGSNPYLITSQAGTTPVWVELIRAGVCTDTLLLDSIAVGQAQAAWMTSKNVICEGEILYLEGLDTTQTSYMWEVNGQIQTGESSANYGFSSANSGMFEIKLATENGACIAEQRDTVFVQNPTASFQINQTSHCYPTQIDFQNTSVNAVDYLWDFGNGDTSHLENPSFTFLQYPSSPVWLKVIDSLGCVDSTMRTDFENFETNISINTVEGCAPLSVQLESSGTSVNQWYWDLGNGVTSTDSIVNFVYTDTGAYTVTLIAQSLFGCTDTVTVNNAVIVHDVFINPVVQLSSNACAPAQYGFQANAHEPYTIVWDFGDGTSSSLANTNHFYLNSGQYQVQIEATSVQGCSVQMDIPNLAEVIGPTALFSPTNSVCLGDSSQFVNLSSDASLYTWYFGNGQSSNDVNPNISYAHSGLYDVTLIATDTFGCSQSLTIPQAAQVFDLPNPQFYFLDSIQCEDEVISMSVLANNYTMNTYFDGIFNTNQTMFFPDNIGWASFQLIETDSNGCINEYVDSVFIEDVVQPTISSINSICEDITLFQLQVDVPGGIWSGNGIDSSGNIHPDALGFGQYQYQYTYGNNCPAHDSILVKIDEKFNANFLLPNTVCQEDTTIYFQAVNDTGYWFVNGLSSNAFVNPTHLAIGNIAVSHVISNGACYDSVRHDMEVRPLPNLDVVIDQNELCFESELSIQGHLSPEYDQIWQAYHKETDSTHFFNQIPTFNQAGSWGIVLKLSDQFGCANSDSLGMVFMLDSIAPSSPEVIRSTVIDNEFTYTEWKSVDDLQKIWGYRIWRTDSEGNKALVDSVDLTTNYFTDYDARVHDEHYEYEITSINKCDLKNKASIGNSILLEGETVNGASNVFQWNPYVHWDEGVDYYELQVLTPENIWQTIKVVPGHINVTDY